MKKVMILLMMFVTSAINAQDIIVKKDGSIITSKVMEIGTSEIKYKKFKNQDGPIYSIAISDVLSVNYENGEKESFENIAPNTNTQNAGSNTVTVPTREREYTLKAGTLIPIQNVNYTRASALSVGQTVQFRVARDVEIDNYNIIPYGTSVKGVVCEAKKSSWFGTKGRLGININEIELPSGVRVPLTNGNIYVTGKNRTPLSVLLFLFVTWPACFITGSKAELPAGYEVSAEVARPVIFNINNGKLVGKMPDSTVSNQYNDEKENLKKVTIWIKGGRKANVILQSEDDMYYYYKLQSRPNGRTYKVKKKKVKEITE